MGDLLKEAIAEAKMLKDIMYQKAKQELTESMTPAIMSKINARLQNEAEDFEDEELEDEVSLEDEEVASEDEVSMEDESEDELEIEEDVNMEDEYSEDEPVEDGEVSMEDEIPSEDEEIEDVDLEEILRELDDESEDEEEVDFDSMESGEEEVSSEDEPVEDDEEEVNLEELFSSLREEDEVMSDLGLEDEEDTVAELKSENYSLKRKLNTYNSTINALKKQISEVNVLNTKLTFISKLFKNNVNLSKNQKTNIIDQFDRTKTIREVKLVYSTLAESLKGSRNIKSLSENINKKVQGTGAPKRENILDEQLANRFTKIINYKRH